MSTRLLVLSTSFILFCFGFLHSQNLSDTEIKKIKTEVYKTFYNSIETGEQLDVKGIENNIEDSLKTGFIDNGNYFKTFNELMVIFRQNIKGLESQKFDCTNKKVTILSEDKVLLTTSGNYETKVLDGRVLKGGFAWTFIYSKINGDWKVIHSHMSNR
ncbi:MAG: nuclear transport factor 2 family protein [Jejuia sp.]